MIALLVCSFLLVASVYGGSGVGYSGNNRRCVDKHNYYRAMHHAPSLVEDYSITRVAQAYAQRLANSGSFKHSGGKYGENLYKMWGSGDFSNACVNAVDSWYKEIKYYNFNRGGFSSRTGHFTQVVWKNSKRLGLGVARRGSTVVVVANYDPAGNYRGQYQQNVLRK